MLFVRVPCHAAREVSHCAGRGGDDAAADGDDGFAERDGGEEDGFEGGHDLAFVGLGGDGVVHVG